MIASRAIPKPSADPRRLAFFLALVLGACGVVFIAYGVCARAYGVVESEMVFEASRLRDGLPLYVDPARGAWEHGPPPSRYYVLYTPTWPFLLAHLGPCSLEGMRDAGRVLTASLYFALLVFLVARADRRNRMLVATGALLATGCFFVAREVGMATADVPATVLSVIALSRMSRRGRLDGLSAVLLVSAPLVKPSVVGAAVGAFVAHAVTQRRRGPRALISPLVAGSVALGVQLIVFHVVSGGAWLEHLVLSTGQTLSAERWLQEFGSRAFVLGLPHAALVVVAIRRRASLVSVLPLATSLLWTTFLMCKHGSATHYWLEPTCAALVTAGALPPSPRERPWLAWAGVALALVVAAVSLPPFVRAREEYAGRRAFLDEVKAACPLGEGEVVMSNDVRLELELDGRVIIPCWQTSYLVRDGRFPLEAWKDDLRRKEVRWLLHTRDLFNPTPDKVEGITEVSAYRKELRAVVEEEFEVERGIGPLVVLRKRR